MKVFNCITYAHVQDVLRKTINNNTKKYMFIIYSHNTKSYKLYNPKFKKIIARKDVTFNKNLAWYWSIEDKLFSILTLLVFKRDTILAKEGVIQC